MKKKEAEKRSKIPANPEKPKKIKKNKAGSSPKNDEIQEIEFSYTLSELPSSQHKAGLAGLYLVIEWLKDQEINKDLFEKTEISETGLKMKLTKQDVRNLFNEIYKPIQVETESKTIRKNQKTKQEIKPIKQIKKMEKIEKYIYEIKSKLKKNDLEPIREEVQKETNLKTGKSKQVTYYLYEEERPNKKKDKTGNEIEPLRTIESAEEKTYFIYLDTYPNGSFLFHKFEPESGLWIKLWRDMMWSILRGVPATRNPYTERFEKKFNNADSDKSWYQLIEMDERKNSTDLPSTYYIGAQSNNAENISFYDFNKNLFLLHFWPFVAQVYAPKKMQYDSKIKDYKLADNGYAICIPDIIRLQSFCETFSSLMTNRSIDKFGYRPAEAVVYFSQVAGLDTSKRLHQVIKQKIGGSKFFEIVHAIDTLHCEKDGNNIRIRANTRIKPDIFQEDEVSRLKKLYINYLFQKQIIENALHKMNQISGFYELFRNYPYEYFFKYGNGNFKIDAVTFFNEEKIKGDYAMEANVTQEKIPKTIELLVYQVIQTYIYSKLESKYQLKWDPSMKSNERGQNFSDKKSKIAKEAFLAIRSRADNADFINYFTSTICSVSQRLGEEGFITLTEALYKDPEKVRALSMLALSANS